jgi:hypothetical protein
VGKLSISTKVKGRRVAQFNPTLGQQNKQIEKLRAMLCQVRSYEPSEFGQTGDESLTPDFRHFPTVGMKSRLSIRCLDTCEMADLLTFW